MGTSFESPEWHVATRLTFRADCLSCQPTANLCVTCLVTPRIPNKFDACELQLLRDGRDARATVDDRRTDMRSRILIVDNDEKVLIELERALEQEGYETETAWNLPEGLDVLADGRFHLLLVGDHPPELNCERVLRVLAREGVDVPVIVMHTKPRHPFAEAFIAHLGAAGVVCKWNQREVVETVQRCIGVPVPAIKPRGRQAAQAS